MMIHNNNLREAVVHDMVTLSREQRYRGVRLIASVAYDAVDCRQLLAALGLDPADGRSPGDDAPADCRQGLDRPEPRSLLERMVAGGPELKAT